MDRGFQIEDIALKTGLTKRALRYYEDLELIKPMRTESGYRLYSEDDVEKVIRIKEIKDSLGFSLINIKEILELEQILNSIFDGTIRDRAIIEEALTKVKHQMDLIEQKEQTLHRARLKCQSKYDKLNAINQQLERTRYEKD